MHHTAKFLHKKTAWWVTIGLGLWEMFQRGSFSSITSNWRSVIGSDSWNRGPRISDYNGTRRACMVAQARASVRCTCIGPRCAFSCTRCVAARAPISSRVLRGTVLSHGTTSEMIDRSRPVPLAKIDAYWRINTRVLGHLATPTTLVRNVVVARRNLFSSCMVRNENIIQTQCLNLVNAKLVNFIFVNLSVWSLWEFIKFYQVILTAGILF